jgi:hypothetical protein
MSAHNRSQGWFGAKGRSGMVYRSRVHNQGYFEFLEGTRGYDLPRDSR